MKIPESTMLARVLVASLAAFAAAEKVKIGDIETFHHAVGEDHHLVNHHQNPVLHRHHCEQDLHHHHPDLHCHQVSGELWALDDNKLMVKNFNYDGAGPDAFFWVRFITKFQYPARHCLITTKYLKTLFY